MPYWIVFCFPGLGLQAGQNGMCESVGALMNQNHGPGKQLEKINPGYGELFSPTQFYFTFLPHERSQIRWKVAFTKISSPF